MFHYIDQPGTPSFPIVLVNTEYNATLVETVLGRWTLVITVISVDACPFLAFSDMTITFRIQELAFSGCTVPHGNKETELGSSNQKASPSTDKKTGVVLVPCCIWKCFPTANSAGVDIPEVPGCHLLQHRSSQYGSQKLFEGLVSHERTAYPSVFDLFLTQ